MSQILVTLAYLIDRCITQTLLRWADALNPLGPFSENEP